MGLYVAADAVDRFHRLQAHFFVVVLQRFIEGQDAFFVGKIADGLHRAQAGLPVVVLQGFREQGQAELALILAEHFYQASLDHRLGFVLEHVLDDRRGALVLQLPEQLRGGEADLLVGVFGEGAQGLDGLQREFHHVDSFGLDRQGRFFQGLELVLFSQLDHFLAGGLALVLVHQVVDTGDEDQKH